MPKYVRKLLNAIFVVEFSGGVMETLCSLLREALDWWGRGEIMRHLFDTGLIRFLDKPISAIILLLVGFLWLWFQNRSPQAEGRLLDRTGSPIEPSKSPTLRLAFTGLAGGILLTITMVVYAYFHSHVAVATTAPVPVPSQTAAMPEQYSQPVTTKPAPTISTRKEITHQIKPCVPASLNYQDGSLSTPPRKPNIAFIGAKGETRISGGGEVGYDVGVDDSCGKSLNVKNFQAIAPHNDLTGWFHYLLTQPLDRQTIEAEIAAEQGTLAQYGRSIRPEITTRLRKLEDNPQALKRYLESGVEPSVKP